MLTIYIPTLQEKVRVKKKFRYLFCCHKINSKLFKQPRVKIIDLDKVKRKKGNALALKKKLIVVSHCTERIKRFLSVYIVILVGCHEIFFSI